MKSNSKVPHALLGEVELFSLIFAVHLCDFLNRMEVFNVLSLSPLDQIYIECVSPTWGQFENSNIEGETTTKIRGDQQHKDAVCFGDWYSRKITRHRKCIWEDFQGTSLTLYLGSFLRVPFFFPLKETCGPAGFNSLPGRTDDRWIKWWSISYWQTILGRGQQRLLLYIKIALQCRMKGLWRITEFCKILQSVKPFFLKEFNRLLFQTEC